MTWSDRCVAVALLLSAACVTAGSRPMEPPLLPTQPERILWLPDHVDTHDTSYGAVEVRNGRSIFADGSAYVGFSTSGSREELSTRIVQHFAEIGCVQRPNQYLNPQFETSFRTGWRHQCGCLLHRDAEGRAIERPPYSDWEGEWENRAGDVVAYKVSASGTELRGFAEYVPKRKLDEIRRMLPGR